MTSPTGPASEHTLMIMCCGEWLPYPMPGQEIVCPSCCDTLTVPLPTSSVMSRARALAVLGANGYGITEAEAFLAQTERDGRAIGPVITAVADTEANCYIMFRKESRP